jgi:hypothetical protein
MLLDSGTWRRAATWLPVDSAGSRGVRLTKQRLEQGENKVKELQMLNSAVLGAPQRAAEKEESG